MDPLSPPVPLDWRDLALRLGDAEGQIKTKQYGDRVGRYGHWKSGFVDFMYREGRVEVRASLPKVLTGRNDVVLNEDGVHRALRNLTAIASELADTSLDLRLADVARLDYAYQWPVESVAAILEQLKVSFHAPRKIRTENVSPHGGRSVTWGYGTRSLYRFYDKGAEVAEQEAKEGFPLALDPAGFVGLTAYDRDRLIAGARRRARDQFWAESQRDKILRFEIQDRRRPKLRLIHEQGYRGSDVRNLLLEVLAPLRGVDHADLGTLIDSYGGWSHAAAFAAAGLYFAEHPEGLAILRQRLPRDAYYRWRRRAREAGLSVGTWTPEIPSGAFGDGCGIWRPTKVGA
ncbi:MAG TPA: phage/plasmid replication protein [Gaiellaceae bacterium]